MTKKRAEFATQGDFTMRNAFVTAGAALVLGGLGFTGPAQAVPPLSRHDAAPLLILAEDIEDQEVQHDIYPDLVPLPSQVGYREGDSRRPRRRTTQRRSQGWRQCGGGGIQRGRHRRQIELPVRRRLKLRRRPQARGTRPGSSASACRTDGPAPARRRSRAASPPRPRPRPSRRSASGRNRRARASSRRR